MIDPDRADIGLPQGTAALALALAAASCPPGWRIDPDAVLAQLLMPLVVGARPQARPPRPAPCGGWVHDDSVDDALVAALSAGQDAEAWAAAAQECWLPITPYRPCRALTGWEPVEARPEPPDPVHIRVLDMTAMWAGPLCTRLLAEWGADVTTVEPAVRPDGFRGSPAQFAVLDVGKRRVDLDLRNDAGRHEFERLVAESDVVVESFSRRVMSNLGYPDLRAINPAVSTVSIRSFPADSPERDWVAYRRGVHAASGLGMWEGRPQPVPIAYPDPLAGFTAFTAARDAIGRAVNVEVTLAEAIAPLRPGPLATGDPCAVRRRAEATNGAMAPALVRA